MSIQDLGPQVLGKELEIRNCGLPAGLGDVFRPGFRLCVPLQPV